MKKLSTLIICIVVVLTFNNVTANTIPGLPIKSCTEFFKIEKNHCEVRSFPPAINFNSLFNLSGIKNSLIYFIKNKVVSFERREINKDKVFLRGIITRPFQNAKNKRKEKRRAKEQEKINDMPPIYR